MNIDASKTHQVHLNIRGVGRLIGKATILTADEVQAHNDFDDPEHISPKDYNGFNLEGGNTEVTIPPFSVVLLELE